MKRKYHVNFSKDSQFPSEIHSYKLLLQMYRYLFGISADLNSHIFELIFNRLAVHLYIPTAGETKFVLLVIMSVLCCCSGSAPSCVKAPSTTPFMIYQDKDEQENGG